MLLEPVSHGAKDSWRLRIDLNGTSAAGAPPRHMALYAMPNASTPADRDNWVRCRMTAHIFEGEGAEVEELVGVFRRWVGPEPRLLEAVAGG